MRRSRCQRRSPETTCPSLASPTTATTGGPEVKVDGQGSGVVLANLQSCSCVNVADFSLGSVFDCVCRKGKVIVFVLDYFVEVIVFVINFHDCFYIKI